jgi:hypothetical protein
LLSPLAQAFDQSPARRQVRLVVSSVGRMVRIAVRLEGGCDLRQRLFGHGEITTPLGDKPHRHTLAAGTPGPFERHAIAGRFLQRRPISGDRLLQPRRSTTAPVTRSPLMRSRGFRFDGR